MHHPFQTLILHTLCPSCAAERKRLLRAFEQEDPETWDGEKRDEREQGWKGLGELRLKMRESRMVERGRIAVSG